MSAPLPLSLQGIQTPGVQPVKPWGTERSGSQSKYKIPKTMEELEVLSQNLIKDFDEVEKLRATLKIVKENRQVSELKIQNYDAQLAEIAAKQAEIQTKRNEIQTQRAEVHAKIAEIDDRQAEIKVQRADIQVQRAELQDKIANVDAKQAEIQVQRKEIQVQQAASQQRMDEIRKELDTGPSDAALLARLARIRAAKAKAQAQAQSQVQ